MHYLVMILLIGATLFSCSPKILPVANDPVITGTWKWTQRQGGFAGKTETVEKTGLNRTLQFSEDSGYLLTENEKTVSEGRFSIIQVKSIYDHKMTDAIHFSDEGHADQLIQSVSADTLILADNHYDGYTDTYVRSR